jgi:hypothetical protein
MERTKRCRQLTGLSEDFELAQLFDSLESFMIGIDSSGIAPVCLYCPSLDEI